LNAALVTSRKCIIPLLTLQGDPFLLVLGDSIFATVSATNVYTESLPSSEGNGGIMLTVPYKPVGLATDIPTNTKSVISLTWNDGITTGASPIIDYRVSWDASTGAGVTFTVLASGVKPRSFTTT